MSREATQYQRDTPQQLARKAISLLETAILKVLRDAKDEYLDAGEINRRLGTYQNWDPEPDQHNIPRYVLHQMLEEKRVVTHTAADGRVIGWQLPAGRP